MIGYEGLGSQDYGGMVLEMMDAIVLFPGGGGGGGGGGLAIRNTGKACSGYLIFQHIVYSPCCE